MAGLNSFIGQELDNRLLTIEAGLIHRIFMAINHPNQFDKAVLLEKPYSNKALPSFILGTLMDTPKIYGLLGLNINNVLLSRESIISHQPIYAGQSLNIKTVLENAYEKQATINPIGFLVLNILGQYKNELIFCCERVLAVRGGFSRKGNL